jgi:hypothetical protein
MNFRYLVFYSTNVLTPIRSAIGIVRLAVYSSRRFCKRSLTKARLMLCFRIRKASPRKLKMMNPEFCVCYA